MTSPVPESNASRAENINKALTMLAHRVTKLEAQNSQTVVPSDGRDLRPVLVQTLADLKIMRTALVTRTSELDGKLGELAAVKAENDKLKYQVMHLKRSMEAESR